jgi:hypothetical protein
MDKEWTGYDGRVWSWWLLPLVLLFASLAYAGGAYVLLALLPGLTWALISRWIYVSIRNRRAENRYQRDQGAQDKWRGIP